MSRGRRRVSPAGEYKYRSLFGLHPLPLRTHLALTGTRHTSFSALSQLSPLPYTMPAKKRCQYAIGSPDHCNQAALRMIGSCPHCNAHFCGSHRLPEHHACNQLESCRQQAFDRNKAKLESERTVASKMATA